MQSTKLWATVLMIAASSYGFADANLDSRIDKMNEQIGQVITSSQHGQDEIISLSIKKNGEYVRIYSNTKELIGKPLPEKTVELLDKDKVFNAKNVEVNGKTCEDYTLKSFENGDYVLGIGTGCK